MKILNDKNLLLCMIGIEGDGTNGELGGITRLQKMMFLLEQEYGIKAKGDTLEFIPYKAGPYSSKLYDSLEFLENLGYIKGEIVGEAVPEEIMEIDALNFEDLIEPAKATSDSYIERSFSLTDSGIKQVEKLLVDPVYEPVAKGIRKVKSKYGNYSLRDLLFYVYSNYPKMTTESEIKAQVLGRRVS